MEEVVSLKSLFVRIFGTKKVVHAPLLQEKAKEILESERNPNKAAIYAAAAVRPHHHVGGFGGWFGGRAGS